MEDTTFQKELLKNGIIKPHITQTIISNNISVLFTGEFQLIAKALGRYYALSDTLINVETLKEKVRQEINTLNKRAVKRGNEELSLENTNAILNTCDTLFEKPNDNEVFLHDLESWVKNKLTIDAILQESTINDDTLAQRVETRISKIKDISLVTNFDTSLDITGDIQKRTDIYENAFKEDRLMSGFTPLDTLTKGLGKREVACVAASSGGFKTGTLTNLAYYYAKQGLNVLYITLEEQVENILVRLDKLFLNVDNSNIFQPDGTVSSQFITLQKDKYEQANKQKHLNLIYRAENPMTLTPDDIDNIILSEERNRNIKFDVLILDYADLLRKPASDNESLVGERLFQALSRIAHERNLLVWTGSQLNRSSNSADIKSIENVEGSYRKVNICSLWLTINVSKEEREQGFLRYHIDKLRNIYGEQKDDFLYVKLNKATFKLLPESSSELENHKALLDGTKSPDKTELVVKKQKQDDMFTAIANQALSGR